MRRILVAGRWLKGQYGAFKLRDAPTVFALREHSSRATRRPSYVKATIEGDNPLRGFDKAAVFCHFDRHGQVHGYVVQYLRSLVEAGFRITFVTNAGKLTPDARAAVRPLVERVLIRDNVGYDFGAYKEGVLSIADRHALSCLVLANDSVYGPLTPLAPLLARMEPGKADIWGLTDSYEYRYHLQSYFVLFHRAALANEAFERHWQRMPYVDNRAWLIHRGEVALTQRLMASGLRPAALIPTDELLAAFRDILERTKALSRDDVEARAYLGNVRAASDAGVPLNPTHFFYELLVRQFGFPFLKRDLLEKNPAGVPGVTRWRELVSAVGDYDPDLIAGHLKLRVRGRVV